MKAVPVQEPPRGGGAFWNSGSAALQIALAIAKDHQGSAAAEGHRVAGLGDARARGGD